MSDQLSSLHRWEYAQSRCLLITCGLFILSVGTLIGSVFEITVVKTCEVSSPSSRSHAMLATAEFNSTTPMTTQTLGLTTPSPATPSPTLSPTTLSPTTVSPTILNPTTLSPTTLIPTPSQTPSQASAPQQATPISEQEIEVVTVCSKPDVKILNGLLSSAIPYPIRILGLHDGPKYNNLRKVEMLYHFLTQQTNPNKLILFVDATDLYFCNCGRDIVQTFLSYNVNILWSAELGCWPPNPEILYSYPNKTIYGHNDWKPYLKKGADRDIFLNGPNREYKQLNSGGFMGYVWALLRALKIIMSNGQAVVDKYAPAKSGDQSHYVVYFLTYYKEHNLGLDYSGSIWASMHEIQPTVLVRNTQNRSLYHKVFKHDVCIIHGNGNAKEWLFSMVDTCRPKWSGSTTFNITIKETEKPKVVPGKAGPTDTKTADNKTPPQTADNKVPPQTTENKTPPQTTENKTPENKTPPSFNDQFGKTRSSSSVNNNPNNRIVVVVGGSISTINSNNNSPHSNNNILSQETSILHRVVVNGNKDGVP